MSGKPNANIINWDGKTMGILRQVLRVAKDEKFRNGEREGITPTAEQIIEEYNVSTDNDWKDFKFDLPTNSRVLEGLEMDTQYASSLVQLLIKKLNLPGRPKWYLKSFAQAWERKR